MSRRPGRWQDGRRAWERLGGWRRSKLESGDGALGALADVGLLRRLLDQVELAAVRVARRHGKSWTEIATVVGVTRQSAWERWRDLDEESAEPAATAVLARDRPRAGVVPVEVVERIARQVSRRRIWAVVPNVVGMSWADAQRALEDKWLVAIGSDPDAAPMTPLEWADATVTDQSPESGAKVPTGSAVRLWTERGGGSGVREPRRPRPAPRAARGMRDEASGEAVG